MRYAAFIFLALSLVTTSTAQEDNGLGRIQQRADLSKTLPNGLTSTLNGAVPDTTSPWRYFPLAVGNIWEEEHYSSSSTWRSAVLKDTIAISRTYFKIRIDGFDSNGDPLPNTPRFDFVRYDTLSASLKAFLVPSQSEVDYIDGCRLDADFDSTIQCPSFTDVQVSGTYDGTFSFPNSPQPDVVTTSIKFYDWIFDTDAAGIGEIEMYVKGVVHERLYYARINALEYGIPRHSTVGNESNEVNIPPLSPLIIRSIFPNPTYKYLTIEYITNPGKVVILLHDLLGRQVQYVTSFSSGVTSIVRLDVSTLPSGIYVASLLGSDSHEHKTFTISH